MIKETLSKALNDQINFEFYSAYVYLAMSAKCNELDLPGFANWLKIQFQEEQLHALKFLNFLTDKEVAVKLLEIKEPRNDYKTLEEIFEEVVKHEETVTEKIYKLADIATKDKEHSTLALLQIFINEQVEEEATVKALLKKIKKAKNSETVMLMLDNEAAARTFVVNPLFA